MGSEFLDASIRAGDNYVLNWAYWCVANDCIYRGLMREAREWAWTLLNAGRDREDQRALGLAHATLGMIHLIGGEFHEAVRNADEAVRTALTPFDRTYGSAIKAMAETSPRCCRGRTDQTTRNETRNA